MIRAIAFDLDGTLIDTAPDLSDAAGAMLHILGREPLSEAQVRTMIGAGISELVRRVLVASSAGRGLNPVVYAGAEALFRKLYRQRLFERSRVYPGVRSTLHTLALNGTALCCITNKESCFTSHLLAAANLHTFFQHTACADLVENRKPSPNLILESCTQLGIEPKQLLYVGDSRFDIIAARAAGCRVAAVTYGYHDSHSLDELHPDELIGSLTEVAGLTSTLCATA
jgi:phosphoglycolate phosphatase